MSKMEPFAHAATWAFRDAVWEAFYQHSSPKSKKD
jgi:hypothetical protein